MQQSAFFEDCPGCASVYKALSRIADDVGEGLHGRDITDFSFVLRCQRCRNERRVLTPQAEEFVDFLKLTIDGQKLMVI
jgi:hypothetical protein